MRSERAHELLNALEKAAADEKAARRGVASARETQAEILGELRSLGVRSSISALRTARALGLPRGGRARKLEAARLRLLASRATRRRGNQVGTPRQAAESDGSSEVKGAAPMPRLVKRITTEEFIADEDNDLHEIEPDEGEPGEEQGDEEQVEDEEVEAKPARGYRGSRR